MTEINYRKRAHECRQVIDSLSEFEQNFLRSVQKWQGEYTVKQKTLIDRIYEKVCGLDEAPKARFVPPTEEHGKVVDNLRSCDVCGAIGQQLTRHCPGRKMTDRELALSYMGRMNFINGRWVET